MTSMVVLRSLGLAAAAILCSLSAFAPAAAASAAPEMSVTISDGVKTAKPGMDVTYTTSVTNLGSDPVDAKVVVSVPSYVDITDAGAGAVETTTATWTVSVAPHQSSDVKLVATIGDIPKGEVRVTAVASVYVEGVEPSPLIRSADADRIQGIADTPAPQATTVPTAGRQGGVNGAIVVALATVVGIAAVAVILVAIARRRRAVRRTG